MGRIDKIIQWIVSSELYFHLYYKHTKKHKTDLKRTYDAVMKRRFEILGK